MHGIMKIKIQLCVIQNNPLQVLSCNKDTIMQHMWTTKIKLTTVVYESRHVTRNMNWKLSDMDFNLLKPTGYVMHRQFNIQQLYAVPTLCLCVLHLSENKQRLVPPTA